jgi:hypothetical protein
MRPVNALAYNTVFLGVTIAVPCWYVYTDQPDAQGMVLVCGVVALCSIASWLNALAHV